MGRQQLAAHEALIVYVHATGEAHAITGTAVPQLDLTSTNPLFVQMVQTGSGAAERGKGEVRWARVELQPNVPEQHLSVIAVSFTEPKLAQLNRVVLLMSGIGAAVLLFTGVIGMLVAGQILRPLRALRQAASSISEHVLTKRLPTQGRDDIAWRDARPAQRRGEAPAAIPVLGIGDAPRAMDDGDTRRPDARRAGQEGHRRQRDMVRGRFRQVVFHGGHPRARGALTAQRARVMSSSSAAASA